MLNYLSLEISVSTGDLNTFLTVTLSLENKDENNLKPVESINAQISKFRATTIAPLQAILASLPQLKLRCEHRKSALNIALRYQKKVDEMRKSGGSRVKRVSNDKIGLATDH